MSYRVMRLRKYYDALKTQKPFFKTSLRQKAKILGNISVFFRSNKSLVLKHKPITAQIEPTSLCNLRCEMCIRDKIGVPIGSMKFEDFKKILDKLDCLFKIHLSGQGESFLNKELFRMIEYANERGALVNINTNAMLFSSELIEKICGVEIGELAVSLESTKKEAYEAIRKGAKFDTVMSNIQELNSKLKEKKKSTIVSFAVTILKDNVEEIPEFVKLAEKTGVKKVIFQTLQNKEDYISKYSKEAKQQAVSNLRESIKGKINEAKQIAKKGKISVIFDEEKSRGCLWPWRGIYINWEGNVTACCKILDYRKPVMGNLLKQDFWDVWNGKEYQMFRVMLRERKAPMPCVGCEMV
jgi:radical SAM protein with 4Fe4S-binding SPASM domain